MGSGANRRKVLVVGLDGVPYTLLSEYIEKGRLPNVRRIVSQGYSLVQMDASIPDVSSTSWASFITGVNPGEHGIFGFTELRPGSYKMSFPNFHNVSAPTVWDIIGGTDSGKSSTLSASYGSRVIGGLRSIVLNIPQTFPASPLNGVLTAGFVCPDLERGTYPDEAYRYLKTVGYVPDIDVETAADDPEAFFSEVFLALMKRAEVYEHFFESRDWDLFIAAITETDRVHHFFYDAALDPGHRYYEKFISIYDAIDGLIGNLYNRFMDITGGEGLFMTMSDHGFTAIRNEVYINAWLREKGLLKLDERREYYEMIDRDTKAFAMDPARIYLNIEGGYPYGSVGASERPRLIEELKHELLRLEDQDGRKVIKKIYENREIYSGPLSERGPDLVCVAHDGFDLKSPLRKKEVFGRSAFRGMHTRHDAHCILPRGTATERLHIEDLAGVILERFCF